MATEGTVIQPAYIAGELAPAMWGRVDNEKYKLGTATFRNGFINFQGGYASRAGLAYVGTCKQAAPNPGTTTVNNTSGGTVVNTGPMRDIPFQFSVTDAFALEFGDYYMRVKYRGAYVTEAAQNVVAISKANPGVISIPGHGWSNGDWIFGLNIGGMTEFNGLAWIVQNATSGTFTLTDLFGTPVDTTQFPAYTSGGTFARLYTLTTPYQAQDVKYLKYTQSADEMSLTCVNPNRLNPTTDAPQEYPPYDLARMSDTDWVLTEVTFAEDIAPPANVAATASGSTTLDTWYSYVVTAVDSVTNSESVASNIASVQNNDISVNAGSNTITWSPVAGAGYYNIYSAIPFYSTSGTYTPQVGVPYGFLGQALGTSFVDTNITPNYDITPPLHNDPFAPGTIVDVTINTPGSGLLQGHVGFTTTSAHGTGLAGIPIVLNGGLNSFYITDGGTGYVTGDTITFFDGDGAAVVGTGTLVVGPPTGTYPATVAYYQERRSYASTTNNPDTYFLTQPGAYTNMDASIPSVDSDAIIGTPWGQQVNGVQFLTPMPGGLVIFTGSGAWQLNGGTANAITPSDQDAQPQSRYGCSSTIPPIPVNFNILFVRENDGIVYNLQYNFWVNIYQGTDITVFSSHLFEGYTLVQWAYSEKPYKLVWVVRNDGTFLSLTYIAEQNEMGWARHDTNGIVVGVCCIEEPPVDAVYFLVQRFVRGQWVYYSERLDNRLWLTTEQCFCVDAGLTYPMSYPAATLQASAANGTNNITSSDIVVGGTGYIAPQVVAIDGTNSGSGATFEVTVNGGVITGIIPIKTGTNYTAGATKYQITDVPGGGSGCIAYPVITNFVTMTASGSAFANSMIGNLIRTGGGKGVIASYTSPTQVTVNMLQPITTVLQNDPDNTPLPQTAGNWSLSVPTQIVSGLNHLEGKTVTGLADGGVIPPTVVTNGQIQLAAPATAICVGLPFLPQMQNLPLDVATPNTVQTKRKNVPSVGLRVHNSRGVQVGSNQPDASANANVNQPWGVAPSPPMVAIKELNQMVPAGEPIPLMTGDFFINIGPNWNLTGKIAFQQPYPLPMNIDAHVSYYNLGDNGPQG